MGTLLYQRAIRFSKGSVASAALATVPSTRKAPADLSLHLKHFREVMNSHSFYSVPVRVLQNVVMESLSKSLAAGPSSSSTGPAIADIDTPKAEAPSSLAQLKPDSDDEYESHCDISQELQTPTRNGCLATALRFMPKEDVVFRISQTRPALRKRPTANRDGVVSDAVVLSQYQVLEQRPDGCIHVQPSKSTDPMIAKLFSGGQNHLDELAVSMKQWSVVQGVDFGLNLPEELDGVHAAVLQMVFEARAFAGSFVGFSTAGCTCEEDLSIKHLLCKGYLVAVGNSSQDSLYFQVQLHTALVDSTVVVLGSPKHTFVIRPGVPFDAALITRNVKPTLLELALKLRDEGWSLLSGTKNKRLRPYCSGSPKHYFHTGRFWYCLSLLNSELIFARGIEAIPHSQSETYYRALLQLPESKLHLLKPGKPASYYRRGLCGASISTRFEKASQELVLFQFVFIHQGRWESSNYATCLAYPKVATYNRPEERSCWTRLRCQHVLGAGGGQGFCNNLTKGDS